METDTWKSLNPMTKFLIYCCGLIIFVAFIFGIAILTSAQEQEFLTGDILKFKANKLFDDVKKSPLTSDLRQEEYDNTIIYGKLESMDKKLNTLQDTCGKH